MEEIFKEIKGYDGKYLVSNLGRIKSTVGNEKILSSSTTKFGYQKISLRKDNKQYYYLVHRLVAEAFLDNPNDLKVVNHKDGNRSNNNVLNLEWCSQFDNIHYGDADKKRSESAKKVDTKPKKVICEDTGIIYDSINQAAKENNTLATYISRCCKRYNGQSTVSGKTYSYYQI